MNTIDAKQYALPDSKFVSTEITGIAVLKSGIVTTEDIVRADQNALSKLQKIAPELAAELMSLADDLLASGAESFRCQSDMLRRHRTYFELSDSTVSLLPPLGANASHIECNWIFSWVPSAHQKANDFNTAKSDFVRPSHRLCTIAGEQYLVPGEFVKKSTSTFMVGVSNEKITADDINRLDSCMNMGFDETISNANCIEVQRLRLYFKLPDGSISKESPLGRADKRIECRSLLQTLSRECFEGLYPISRND